MGEQSPSVCMRANCCRVLSRDHTPSAMAASRYCQDAHSRLQLPPGVWRGVLAVTMHMTWLVNSAVHIWGSQPYASGDNSRNNALVALLVFGDVRASCCFSSAALHCPFIACTSG
jgi:hypothetical protein